MKRGRRTRQEDRVAALEALYAELPRIECQGLCWDSCGRIPILHTERVRIADTAGINIPDGTLAPTPGVCPALTMLRRCGAYEIRPMICRLWGLADNLSCPFGCVPEGGRLSVAEGYEMLARALDIDGRHDVAAKIREPLATPESAAAFTHAALEDVRRRDMTYDLMEQRAKRDGTGLFVQGRGVVSRTARGEGTDA